MAAMRLCLVILLCSLLAIALSISPDSTGEYCNETVCGSIVSKCQLLKKCYCDPKAFNTTCNQECYKCLDVFYIQCCSCVQMCPKQNSTSDLLLSSQSHVEDLPEPMPLLFTTITEEEDPLQRWTLETFPLRMSFVTTGKQRQVTSSLHHPYIAKMTTGDGLDGQEDVTVNCTVAFMADCMPYSKCKSSCTSMGASAYRWFHDGCCECVGPHCINYGMNESKCLLCPLDNKSKEDALMRVDIAKSTGTSSDKLVPEKVPASSIDSNLAKENKVTHHSTSPSGSSDILDYEMEPAEPEEVPKQLNSQSTAEITKDQISPHML